MADKTLFIARNDPAKQRKKLGKVKDLLEAAIDDAQMYEFDIAPTEKQAVQLITDCMSEFIEGDSADA